MLNFTRPTVPTDCRIGCIDNQYVESTLTTSHCAIRYASVPSHFVDVQGIGFRNFQFMESVIPDPSIVAVERAGFRFEACHFVTNHSFYHDLIGIRI